MQDTIRAADPTAYGPGGEPQESVDQDTWLYNSCDIESQAEKDQ